jgi:hypothetical protein
LGPRWDPAGCLGGRRRLGALVPPPFGGGGGEVGVGGEVRGGGEVGGRCTSQGGAKQAARERPNALLSVGPGGDPAAPNTQHPTPNTQRPTPNTQKINHHGSRRQVQRCFGTTYKGPLQSIPSVDLVVAALEHPTPKKHPTPNAQRPTPNPQKNKPPRIATPTSEVLQNSVWRRPAKYPVRRPRRRRPRAPNTQKNAQHPTPNTQRPTPNAQHPTPNTQRPTPKK